MRPQLVGRHLLDSLLRRRWDGCRTRRQDEREEEEQATHQSECSRLGVRWDCAVTCDVRRATCNGATCLRADVRTCRVRTRLRADVRPCDSVVRRAGSGATLEGCRVVAGRGTGLVRSVPLIGQNEAFQCWQLPPAGSACHMCEGGARDVADSAMGSRCQRLGVTTSPRLPPGGQNRAVLRPPWPLAETQDYLEECVVRSLLDPPTTNASPTFRARESHDDQFHQAHGRCTNLVGSRTITAAWRVARPHVARGRHVASHVARDSVKYAAPSSSAPLGRRIVGAERGDQAAFLHGIAAR